MDMDINIAILSKARVLVIVSHFHSSMIFTGKARYVRVESCIGSTLKVALVLPPNIRLVWK